MKVLFLDGAWRFQSDPYEAGERIGYAAATVQRGGRVPSLFLRRPSLDDLPEMPPLPPGCALRERRRDDLHDLAGLATLLGVAFPDMDWTPDGVHGALVADATVEATFVVERDGTLVATASARRDEARYPGSGYVHWVAVHPEHRGLRLGYAVSLATLHEFARRGCRDAVLETDDFRLAAIKTYLRLGFAPEFRHPSHPERWAKIRSALAGEGSP